MMKNRESVETVLTTTEMKPTAMNRTPYQWSSTQRLREAILSSESSSRRRVANGPDGSTWCRQQKTGELINGEQTACWMVSLLRGTFGRRRSIRYNCCRAYPVWRACPARRKAACSTRKMTWSTRTSKRRPHQMPQLVWWSFDFHLWKYLWKYL